MTNIKLVDNREDSKLTRGLVEVGNYLYNTETGGLSLIADLETTEDIFYGVLDITKHERGQHDITPLFSELRDSLVDGDLKGKYLPVEMEKTEVTINFSVNEDNMIPEEYLSNVGDVFYHPDSDELVMLVNYETDSVQWNLVSLTTGNNMEASDTSVCTLGMDYWDINTVFDSIALLIRNRVILPVSDLEFKYTLK